MRLICQLLRTDMGRFLLNVLIRDDILLLQKFLFIIIDIITALSSVLIFCAFSTGWTATVFEWSGAVVLAASAGVLLLGFQLGGEAHGSHVRRHAQEKETRKHVGNERADQRTLQVKESAEIACNKAEKACHDSQSASKGETPVVKPSGLVGVPTLNFFVITASPVFITKNVPVKQVEQRCDLQDVA